MIATMQQTNRTNLVLKLTMVVEIATSAFVVPSATTARSLSLKFVASTAVRRHHKDSDHRGVIAVIHWHSHAEIHRADEVVSAVISIIGMTITMRWTSRIDFWEGIKCGHWAESGLVILQWHRLGYHSDDINVTIYRSGPRLCSERQYHTGGTSLVPPNRLQKQPRTTWSINFSITTGRVYLHFALLHHGVLSFFLSFKLILLPAGTGKNCLQIRDWVGTVTVRAAPCQHRWFCSPVQVCAERLRIWFQQFSSKFSCVEECL